jgi:AraC-like DNA-binding protein
VTQAWRLGLPVVTTAPTQRARRQLPLHRHRLDDGVRPCLPQQHRAGLAAFEADLIRERTMPGLSAARARGRLGGRPPKMSPDKLQVAREMYESKQHTLEAIAKTIGVSRTTLCRHLYAQSTSCAA